jgi:predicted GIY-YIG superfamily endonuclease
MYIFRLSMCRITSKVYVLKLINNKFYIGKSTNVEERIKNHFISKGSCWTQKYKPIEVVEIMDNADPFDEDKKVKQYMMKYGIDAVRGGTYSKIILSDIEKQFINRELLTALDKCFKCGLRGHFQSNCKKN